MKNQAVREATVFTREAQPTRTSCPNGALPLHPAWQALIRFCSEVGHGEIERIKIQDGLPVAAEVVTRKIRWC
jgi:hypothetical protein